VEALEQIARASQETLALCDLTDLITARPDTDATLALIADKVARLVPHATQVIYLTVEDGAELEAVYAAGMQESLFLGMRIRLDEGASGWVAARNEPVVNGSAMLDVARRLKPTDTLELNATLSVPLLGEGGVIGVLTLYHTSYDFFKPHHLRMLSLLAEHAGPALERARQFSRTHRLALEDTITGLPNARALMYFLERQIAESQREEREFVLLLADLDNFKPINDRLGHLEGDRVLEQVARVLESCVRQMDMVARYAGDEFVIVLPNAGPETAARIIERIRTDVEHTGIKSDLPIGISIGQAVYPADGTHARRLLGIADGRMYADKSERKRWQEEADDERPTTNAEARTGDDWPSGSSPQILTVSPPYEPAER
jgi:diguanylate cyclase (GGDEF)-like protein